MARILIVDDDPAGRQLLASLARHRGHEPLEAADGAEALDIVRRERPQLVISDILMPTMDGYEFLRRLRADADIAATEIIFYTASYHEREAVNLAGTGGVARVLLKPCEPAELLRAIDEVLQGKPAEPATLDTRTFDANHLRLLTDKLWLRTNELESANARFAALTDLHVQLASERNPQVLLEQVCQGARKLFGARYAVLAARDKSGNGDAFLAVSGIELPSGATSAGLIETGALGRVAATCKAWRARSGDGPLAEVGLPPGCPPPQACLAAPIVSLTRGYGWVCLVDKVGADGFSGDEERLVSILGAQVGRIYENGSLYLELQRRAQLLVQEIAERDRANEQLRSSEERFRQLAENIQDAFFVASADLRELIYLSPAYERIWGQAPPPTLIFDEVLLERAHAADRERVSAALRRTAASGGECDIQYRIERRDGQSRWIQLRTYPVAQSNRDTSRLVGTVRDVTESRVAGARIEQLNRIYAVLSSINALIVRVAHRDELFRETCRLAVEFGGFALAWIGLLDEASGRIPAAAWAGLSQDLVQRYVPELAPDPADDGLVATALRRGEVQVCNDIAELDRKLVFREQMLERGYRAIISLPLSIEGKSIGCLVLVTEQAGFFTDEELRLLTELANDISFALDHIAKGERLHHLAYYDSLTGLANRTLFLDRLSQRLEAAARDRHSLALVVMAPERLSSINDTFGRAAGDVMLAQFAGRFAETVGNRSAVARVTGDQLAAIVDELSDETEVLRYVGRWQEHCFGKPFVFQDSPMRLTGIAGIALYPDDGRDAGSLLHNAESALERAKVTGDEFLFYTQRMSVAVTQKLMLEHALREAQDNQEFLLYYQPKVDLETRRVKSLEALIRWKNPDRGLVSPLQFIPLMEETGMIVGIGQWVMRQAAVDRKRWMALGTEAPRVAVNVSTVQLRRRDFVDCVREIMTDAGPTPGIDFEVTESLIMEDVDSNIRKLEEIQQMGIGIALDDFGTGYSSLGYLSKLPVETLKIDRSFVQRMLEDPGAMTLVSTMIQLAHSLKLAVVAEGVESEEQAKILRLLRCNEIQGYLICKPLPFDEMTEFLRQAGP